MSRYEFRVHCARDRDRDTDGAPERDLWHSRNPHRLYRNRKRRWIAGVCAGLADYTGLDVTLVRILAFMALMFFFPAAVLGYLGLAFLLPPRPEKLYRSQADERFWRSVSATPNRTLDGLKAKFRDLEVRLRRMEAKVTSDSFDLDAKFRDLEG